MRPSFSLPRAAGSPGMSLGSAAMAVAQLAFAATYLRGGAQHGDLWPPDWRDAAGLVLSASSLFIAAGGGIGGGALLVPILLIVMNFQPNNAVALSNVTVVGGAVANFAYNVRKRHPSGDRSLIYWDLILVMEPTTVLGAVAGGYFNKLLPGWMTTILLALLLTALSAKLISRGVRTYRAESKHLAQHREAEGPEQHGNGDVAPQQHSALHSPAAGLLRQGRKVPAAMDYASSFVSALEDTSVFEDAYDRAAAALDGVVAAAAHTVSDLAAPLLPASTAHGADADLANGEAETAPMNSPRQQERLAGMLKAESRQLPWQHLATLALLTAAVITSDLGKGRVPCAGGAYWAIALSVVPLTAVICGISAAWLTRKFEAKQAAGRQLAEGEVAWTRRNTIVYPAVCSVAGLVAGMFGVGGGIVKGPLMLEMGVLPEVASATSATMILFTSFSAAATYAAFGTVKVDYGIALFIVGLVFTFAGQWGAHYLMRKLQRRSIVIFSMASLMSLAAVVMAGESVFRTVEAVKQHRLLDWGSICGT